MKRNTAFKERPAESIEVTPETWRRRTRRDFLVFGASALGVLAVGRSWRHEGWLANKALRFDDHVAEALYSPSRLVPTYTKSQITPLKNNYNGANPRSRLHSGVAFDSRWTLLRPCRFARYPHSSHAPSDP